MIDNEIEIRECETIEELAECVALQREVFVLPDIELSPVRHLVVTKHAGGFTLGAYKDDELEIAMVNDLSSLELLSFLTLSTAVLSFSTHHFLVSKFVQLSPISLLHSVESGVCLH